jgi:hypothetical protein
VRWVSGNERPDERGITVVLAPFLVIVLVAMAALVIDVGRLYTERRELQNGADAGALAVAQDCALGRCEHATSLATAQALADGNARDGTSTVDSLTFDSVARRVEVSTSTRTRDGGSLVPYAFGQILSGERGRRVTAKAVARWGSPSSATALRLTISLCDWNTATGSGARLTSVFTGPPTVVTFHGSGAGSCSSVSGQDVDGDNRLTGGFGWLAGTGCEASISALQWVREDPGASMPSSCDLGRLVNTTVVLPIFDDSNGLGGRNGAYHIDGFAAFRLVGFRFPGKRLGPTPGCAGNRTCIAGYFTRVVSAGGAVGGPSRGAIAVVLAE